MTSGLHGWTNTLNINSRKLAVVGNPIEHSLSPQLHAAAYQALGLPWEYDRILVPEGELASRVGSLDETWLGISVTMPLKPEAFALATEHDVASAQSQVSNTLLFENGLVRGFNTDVAGLVNPLRRLYLTAGVAAPKAAVIVGSGATARSAVLALAELGVEHVEVVARSRERAKSLFNLCNAVKLSSSFTLVDKMSTLERSDLTLSTLPGSAQASLDITVHEGDVLFDIAYDVWPSKNAQRWTAQGGHAVSGLSMLSAQALEQVRIFVTGSSTGVLPFETEVRIAMNASVGLDETGLHPLSVG